jgi:hypothetical protein
MDKETIQQIAGEVVARLPFGDRYWLFLIINIVAMALAAAVAAFGGSYFKTRGQHFATKADFNSLQKQLKATTQLVETIKSEVAQKDWARREWTTLRRIKLEALMEKMHECELYVERRQGAAFEGKPMTPERDCIAEAEALAALYFPELNSEVRKFILSCGERITLIDELASAYARDDLQVRDAAYRNFRSQSEGRYDEFLDARDTLTAAARSLLTRIMNVDESAAPSDER